MTVEEKAEELRERLLQESRDSYHSRAEELRLTDVIWAIANSVAAEIVALEERIDRLTARFEATEALEKKAK